MSVETIDKLRSLLQTERRCDIEETERFYRQYDPQTLQRKGLCLLNLRITGTRSGLGGKQLVDLEPGAVGMNPLPSHRFRLGDIISLQPYDKSSSASGSGSGGGQKNKNKNKNTNDTDAGLRGVVHSLNDYRITVALQRPKSSGEGGDDEEDSGLTSTIAEASGKFRLNRLVDDVNYRRMEKALDELRERMNSGRPDQLLRVLFGQSEPSVDASPPTPEIQVYDQGLNGPQREAVEFALTSREVCLIHGPPGTGKTTVLVEIIRQLLNNNSSNPPVRLLVCAPSNVAVDNLLERVPEARGKHSVPMVRLGHPSRMMLSVLDISLDAQLRYSDAGQLVADIRREMDQTLAAVAKSKSKADRRSLYTQLKELRRELRVREPAVTKQIINDSRVVWSTLSGAGTSLLDGQQFDVVLIDEVSQAMEPETWIALLKGRKLILAGDPLQLPPTIKSNEAARKGLERTLFDRLADQHGDKAKRLLSIQYRMNDLIMNWTNDAMYKGKLSGDEAVRGRRLMDLSGVKQTDDTEAVLVFIDTAGCDIFESVEEDGDSKLNQGEAQLAASHVKRLIDAGLRPEDIAVITPYNAQVQCIKSLLIEMCPQLEIGSVDGFQGREKEAIVISLVRSNSSGEVGFLAESRRLNVAITRAKRHVCLIGDSETVGRDKFMHDMVDYFNEHADLRYPTAEMV